MTFDPFARTYDDDFTRTRTGAWLRERTHERMLARWPSGAHVLELGCGTGEDARFLATNGIRVTATDASPAMLQAAQHKNADLETITYAPLDLNALPENGFDRAYEGVLANFGAANAVQDWEAFGAWLAPRVKSGGVVMMAVMGRVCLWETLWHLAHLNPRTAFRRWSGAANFHGMTVYYPTPRQVTKVFSPSFEHVHLQPLGVFLPPSDVYGVIEKRLRLFDTLTALEARAVRVPALARVADHYWIEMQRYESK